MSTRTISVIFNCGSGSQSKEAILSELREALGEAQLKADFTRVEPGDDFVTKCDAVVKNAIHNDAVVVAVGGDGTVNAAAALCCLHQVTLGIIPLGTFNYFARDLKIPTTLREAVAVLATGTVRAVTVGKVGERLFLNNASFGLYTKLIRRRELDKAKFGRLRIVAFLSAITSLFLHQRKFLIKVRGEDRKMRSTTMVFVGNNTLQLDNFGLSIAECTQNDKLGVLVLREMTKFQTALFLLRGLFRNLDVESHLEQFCADHFEVEVKRKRIDVAIDGEIVACKVPLAFSVEARALNVIVP
jgi:diacylglycerol kinase family enzyme